MPKFSGIIGYTSQSEISPGVWGREIIERNYRGDILQNVNRWKEVQNVNDDITIDNRFSIISDPYALENLGFITYIKWKNIAWKVSKIELKRPRIIITVEGVYNGATS
jgi:hypothetical protein